MTVLTRFKPGASTGTHLLVAALMWSTIGIYLMVRGVLLCDGAAGWWLFAAAVAVGSVKALWLLDRSARRNIERIRQRGDGFCIGAVYSLKMWAMVVVMMVAGRLLRTSHLPAMAVGLLYVAIGWGLLLASRLFWQAWRC